VKSVSFYLEQFQRYGVLKNVQLFGPTGHPVFYAFTPPWQQYNCDDRVCLSVCLFAATSPELHAPYSPNFMCTSPTYDVHNVTLLMHLMNLMIMGTFKNSHICKKHVHQMKWALLGRFPTLWIYWSCRFGGNVFRLCAQDECNSWLFPGPVCRWSESRVV